MTSSYPVRLWQKPSNGKTSFWVSEGTRIRSWTFWIGSSRTAFYFSKCRFIQVIVKLLSTSILPFFRRLCKISDTYDPLSNPREELCRCSGNWDVKRLEWIGTNGKSGTGRFGLLFSEAWEVDLQKITMILESYSSTSKMIMYTVCIHTYIYITICIYTNKTD